MRNRLHDGFARMLARLGLELAAVREIGDGRLLLAVRCDDIEQAARDTDRIVHELRCGDPALAGRDLKLGEWMGRLVDDRLLLFWSGVELASATRH